MQLLDKAIKILQFQGYKSLSKLTEQNQKFIAGQIKRKVFLHSLLLCRTVIFSRQNFNQQMVSSYFGGEGFHVWR